MYWPSCKINFWILIKAAIKLNSLHSSENNFHKKMTNWQDSCLNITEVTFGDANRDESKQSCGVQNNFNLITIRAMAVNARSCKMWYTIWKKKVTKFLLPLPPVRKTYSSFSFKNSCTKSSFFFRFIYVFSLRLRQPFYKQVCPICG